MKYFLTHLLISFTLIVQSQSTIKWDQDCFKIVNGVEYPINCDEMFLHLPTPIFNGNVDSLCLEMEKLFVETLNEWRRNHGIHELEYDSHMERVLTNPHNKWQVENGQISHNEGDRLFSDIVKSVGLSGVGECCAYNFRHDVGGVSEFFNQYKHNPPHWRTLTDEDINYISASVLYEKEKNKYYSVVNVR